MPEYNRLDAIKMIKQNFLIQTEIIMKDCFAFFKRGEYSKYDPKYIRLYADILHYACVLHDYLIADWSFMQYSFMDEDYGVVVYDISDKMIEYMYRGEINANDIIDAMLNKKPWYGPIDDRFIDKYVLTTFHRLAADYLKGEAK